MLPTTPKRKKLVQSTVQDQMLPLILGLSNVPLAWSVWQECHSITVSFLVTLCATWRAALYRVWVVFILITWPTLCLPCFSPVKRLFFLWLSCLLGISCWTDLVKIKILNKTPHHNLQGPPCPPLSPIVHSLQPHWPPFHPVSTPGLSQGLALLVFFFLPAWNTVLPDLHINSSCLSHLNSGISSWEAFPDYPNTKVFSHSASYYPFLFSSHTFQCLQLPSLYMCFSLLVAFSPQERKFLEGRNFVLLHSIPIVWLGVWTRVGAQ